MEDIQVWRSLLAWMPEDKLISVRFRYSDRTVLTVLLWSALHDRPVKWACRAANWPDAERPADLPDESTICRRSRRLELKTGMSDMHARSVQDLSPLGRYGAADGRSLLVGGASKDPDARAGRAVGGLGKGYKLHAIVHAARVITTYEIQPLNVAEPTVARRLLEKAPPALTRIVADGVYDSMKLHEIAQTNQRRLYTPVRQNRVGRRQQPRRLQLLNLSQHPVGKRLLHSRDEIERTFALTSNIGLGFKGLPNWVRRIHRVERWMWCKIMLYHAYLAQKRNAA